MITYSYDAYGNTTKSNNTLNNPYQYNAEYTDSSTGLQYLRARYYDSSQGRFTTKDFVYGFVQLPITFNPYTNDSGALGKEFAYLTDYGYRWNENSMTMTK